MSAMNCETRSSYKQVNDDILSLAYSGYNEKSVKLRRSIAKQIQDRTKDLNGNEQIFGTYYNIFHHAYSYSIGGHYPQRQRMDNFNQLLLDNLNQHVDKKVSSKSRPKKNRYLTCRHQIPEFNCY